MKKILVLGGCLSLLLVSVPSVPGQEQTGMTIQAPETQQEQVMLWLWGEVVSVDKGKKTLVVRYLDYEADAEKKISICVDEKTTFEIINSLDEIQPLDTVSIDYIVTPDGNNIARNISVERPEAVPASEEETPEIAPEDLQQITPTVE